MQTQIEQLHLIIKPWAVATVLADIKHVLMRHPVLAVVNPTDALLNREIWHLKRLECYLAHSGAI